MRGSQKAELQQPSAARATSTPSVNSQQPLCRPQPATYIVCACLCFIAEPPRVHDPDNRVVLDEDHHMYFQAVKLVSVAIADEGRLKKCRVLSEM